MVVLRFSTKTFLEIVGNSSHKYNTATSRLFSSSPGTASKLFVKGISFSSTEKSLADAFSKFGEIVEVNIIRGKTSNRSKGYGYVTFATENEARMALTEMNGKVIDGHPVFVDNVRLNSYVGKERKP